MKKSQCIGVSGAAGNKPFTVSKHKKHKRSERNPLQGRYERDPMSSPDPPSIHSNDEHQDSSPPVGRYGTRALVSPRTPGHTHYHSPTRALTPLTPSSPSIWGQYYSEAAALLSPSPSLSRVEHHKYRQYDNPKILFSPSSGEYNQSKTQLTTTPAHNQSDDQFSSPFPHLLANAVLASGSGGNSGSSIPEPAIPRYSEVPDCTKSVKDFIAHNLQHDESKVFIPPSMRLTLLCII